jgi:hypothetical protein
MHAVRQHVWVLGVGVCQAVAAFWDPSSLLDARHIGEKVRDCACHAPPVFLQFPRAVPPARRQFHIELLIPFETTRSYVPSPRQLVTLKEF